jgi:hypothetical protein
MALASAAVGTALERGAVQDRLERVLPVLGSASLLFGVWYAAAAV